MRTAKLLLALVTVSVASSALAVPAFLIVQAQVAGPEGANPNVPIGHFLAQELRDGGRVEPIVWSLEDPIFRTAVEEKLVPEPRGNPPLEVVLQGAAKMHADYVFVVSAWREGEKVRARGLLFRRGSIVWIDPDAKTPGSSNESGRAWAESALAAIAPASKVASEFIVSVSDPENGIRSLARTWAMKLQTEPLRTLPVEPLVGTPQPAQGQMPAGVDTPTPGTVDNKELLATVEGLTKEGRYESAVVAVRDAIDAEPLDVERRRRLIELLLHMGRPELACTEAQAAAQLIPDRPHLWALAAQAALEAGQLETAQDCVNELVARAPQNPDARLLLGEVRLRMLDPDGAVEHLSAAIELSPTNEAYFLRAVASALNGKIDEAAEDLKRSRAFSLDEPIDAGRRYGLVATLLDQFGADACSQLRDLIPIARVRPKDAEVAKVVGQRWTQLQGIVALQAQLEVPESHRRSFERRDLALKLLAQTLSEIRTFLKDGDEGLLGEATINLGETLKNLSLARELAASEGSARGE
ncbi:MAG: tetratricopeptide repeat protein [Fimbriimonadaceae bacterium]|nr:tetratricopeptide repeat protein [Fimbriimonadaceae bacterium]